LDACKVKGSDFHLVIFTFYQIQIQIKNQSLLFFR
jgi:hypothetical protein